VGYLQSLWVDASGNLREDTNANLALDVGTDKMVTYFLDPVEGDTKIKRYAVSAGNPYPDPDTSTYEILDLDQINPLWEAGKNLAERDLSINPRAIFTYLDKDKDGLVDEGTDNPWDDLGEVVRFHTSGVSNIMPYLGVRDDTTWSYLGYSQRDRTLNLIDYIHGKDSGFSGVTNMAVRTRLLEGNVWKLGDIVHSTPVSVSKPPDNFHIIYGDESYQNFYNAFKNRETVVYVGANDGMLHAFTSWVYDSTTKEYRKPTSPPDPYTAPALESIGDELWAYIPQTLLPHLKWFPYIGYTHVYYVDLKPKVFDAKILPDDTHYTDSDTDDNWGTILLGGLNYGGKQICVYDTFTDESGVTVTETRNFGPSYFAMDVTDPRNPRLLWEKTYRNLGFTTGTPAVVRVKDKWFAVFGSGPTDYEGNSNQKGRVFVVDLKTGNGYPKLGTFASGTTDAWLFEGAESAAFMNSPVSMDKELNYNVDAVYFGESYYSGTWKGKVYKISIPWDWADITTYVDNPNDSTNPWKFAAVFDTDCPITAPLALSLDTFDNVWMYFGTGRYIGQADKTSTNTQYLFGVVDPFFKKTYDTSPTDYYHNYTKTLLLDIGDLFAADPYVITTDGTVFNGTTYFGDWDYLLAAARAEDGWYRTLTIQRERAVTKFTLLGGIAFAPSFVPNSDVCGFGGDSYLYGLYYETGTAYYEPVLPESLVDTTLGTEAYQKVLEKISLGAGKSSALGIHVGQESGAKAFIQQSTGAVLGTLVNPAFNIKSGLINWRQ